MAAHKDNKRTEDACRLCIYQGNPEYCYHCIRQYSGLPDRFTSAEPFFEDVPPEDKASDKWPDNLYREIKGLDEDTYTKRPKDLSEKADAALKSLGNLREAETIRLRFKSGMTLRDIGKSLSITAERVRQIQHKALRKLRHPSRMMILEYGEGNFESPPYQDDKSPAGQAHDVSRGNSQKGIKLEGNPEDYGILPSNDITTLGLSLRICLALKKAGISTVEELERLSEEELLKTKGIGSAAAGSIREALRRSSGVPQK